MDDASKKHLDRVMALFAEAKQHHAQGRFADAERCYRQVVAAAPNWAEGINNLGSALWAQTKAAEAVDHFRRAVAADPSYALAHYNLGFTLLAQGSPAMAEQSLTRAIELKPGFAEAEVCLGNLHLGRNEFDLATGHYRRALQIDPRNAQAHNNIATILITTARLDEAEVSACRAIDIDATSAESYNNLGLILDHQGKIADAMIAFRNALNLKPDFAEAHFNLSQAKRFTPDDPDLAALRKMPSSNVLVNFALGKALDDIGEYDRAIEQFAAGNQQKRRTITYDEDRIREQYHRIVEVFNKSLFERHQGSGHSSDVPIFVLGMPRSGSTLVEQILASHPQIDGAGELTLLAKIVSSVPVPFPDFANSLSDDLLIKLAADYLKGLPALPAQRMRVTDKMPGNFIYAGLIHLILPNAKIIHTIRDPADTCFSCYSKLFAAGAQYSYDQRELGRYYRLYSELMDHWRAVLPAGVMLDVSYEAMVKDPEGESRRLIEHSGLAWDARCLDFHQNTRAVATPSRMNVREPIYRRSVDRWRKYASGLQPLLDELSHLKKR